MKTTPSEKEFNSVMKLDIHKRMKYFRNVVSENLHIFLSYDDNNNLFACYDSNDNECICLWPYEIYAKSFLENNEELAPSVAHLKPMKINRFLDEYIYELVESNTYIIVFPTEKGGAIMTAESFKNMMEEELSKYYDEEDEY